LFETAMPHTVRWKTILLWLVLVASLILVVPSLLPRQLAASLPAWLATHRLEPGLDLTGGSRIALEIDRSTVAADQLHAAVDAIAVALRTARIPYVNLNGTDRDITLDVMDASKIEAARSALSGLALGALNDDGKGTFTIVLPEAAIRSATEEAAALAVEAVRRRVATIDIASATISRESGDRIAISMPGLRDPQAVKDLLSQRGQLAARLVDNSVTLETAIENGAPSGAEIVYSVGEPPVGYVLRRENLLTAADIASAEPVAGNTAAIQLQLNSEATARLAELTGNNVGRTIAIVLDGQVISASVIREAVLGGAAQVVGDFDAEGAANLARVIASGPLPAALTIIEERSVEPSLGAASIQSALITLAVALIAVAGFITFFYGVLGVIASVSLFFILLVMLAALALIGAPITLPAVAGMVLTIGMAVDSSVLIFERIREEKKAGRPLADAVDAGFSRGLSTVIDASVTTLIAVAVLLFLASGQVQGFAITVGVGVLATLLVTFTLTRRLVSTWLRRSRATHLPKGVRTGMFDGLSIRFMAARNVVFMGTALLSLAVAGLLLTNGLNLGIDFTGGSALELRARSSNADLADIAGRLSDANVDVMSIDRRGSPATALVRIAPRDGGENAEQTSVLVARGELEDDYEFRRVEVVGPSVSDELINSATLGILAGLVALVVYIWVRFEWHFAIGAVISLAHDIFLTIGLFALTGLEFNIGAVAALLTVAGYSLNDTVVVYDRIRENLRHFRQMPLPILIDDAINRTLSRTVLTSATTLIALAALSVFGGEVIRTFALTLFFGIAIGTLSSIYIAGPILILFRLRPEHYRPGKAGGSSATKA
jgi:SecD/SecF fusion protein